MGLISVNLDAIDFGTFILGLDIHLYRKDINSLISNSEELEAYKGDNKPSLFLGIWLLVIKYWRIIGVLK